MLVAFGAISCDLNFLNGQKGDSYTVAECSYRIWDATHITTLVQDVYREEIIKAQTGCETQGVYVVVRGLEGCDAQKEQALAGAAAAKERVLRDGLQEVDGQKQCPLYRCVAVDTEEEADFYVSVYTEFLFDTFTITRDYYKFTHIEPVEFVQPQAVDLGLDVLWASCNVGAAKPESYGAFFAWGETAVKTEYTKENYKWWDGTRYTKYFGNVKLNSLESEDDAATVNLGNGWRTPTRAEFEALIGGCEWKVDTVNLVRGCTVTGKNGNSIFIPMAGAKDEKGANTVFSFYGNYHTSEIYSGKEAYQYYFRFHGSGQFIFEDCASEGALPVRAVKSK